MSAEWLKWFPSFSSWPRVFVMAACRAGPRAARSDVWAFRKSKGGSKVIGKICIKGTDSE